MKVEQFSNSASLANKNEVEKIELLAFYFSENKEQHEFSVADMCSILVGLGFARPNATRLKGKIQKSRSFVKGSKKDLFRLSVKKAAALRKELPDLSESEEIVSDDSLLPEILFLKESKENCNYSNLSPTNQCFI